MQLSKDHVVYVSDINESVAENLVFVILDNIIYSLQGFMMLIYISVSKRQLLRSHPYLQHLRIFMLYSLITISPLLELTQSFSFHTFLLHIKYRNPQIQYPVQFIFYVCNVAAMHPKTLTIHSN